MNGPEFVREEGTYVCRYGDLAAGQTYQFTVGGAERERMGGEPWEIKADQLVVAHRMHAEVTVDADLLEKLVDGCTVLPLSTRKALTAKIAAARGKS